MGPSPLDPQLPLGNLRSNPLLRIARRSRLGTILGVSSPTRKLFLGADRFIASRIAPDKLPSRNVVRAAKSQLPRIPFLGS
jgi:hypothetical protein